MRLSRLRGRGALAAAVVGPVATALALAPAGPAHADDVPCWALAADDPTVRATGPALPLDLMRVPDAHQVLGGPLGAGYGVTVAVVDSGIAPASGLAVVARRSVTDRTEVVDPHGTVVAGLIAGAPRPSGRLVGVAPTAQLVDVRVYDTAYPTEPGAVGVEAGRVAAGLRWVARNAERLDISVVTVPLAVPSTAELAAAVRAVQRAGPRGVVVVAPTGNRPEAEVDPLYADFATPGLGEDAVDAVFPAGYPGVVGVNATMTGHPDSGEEADVRSAVLQSSATDVAAPTFGAISVALNGSTCVLPDVQTSLAAAEVAGVVAMLRSRFPEETAEQVTRRLVDSASGRADDPTLLQGAGVVQPVEALTRPLPDPEAPAVASAAEDDRSPAVAPARTEDTQGAQRRRALWWGLLGGAALVLALVLSPLLGRRG